MLYKICGPDLHPYTSQQKEKKVTDIQAQPHMHLSASLLLLPFGCHLTAERIAETITLQWRIDHLCVCVRVQWAAVWACHMITCAQTLTHSLAIMIHLVHLHTSMNEIKQNYTDTNTVSILFVWHTEWMIMKLWVCSFKKEATLCQKKTFFISLSLIGLSLYILTFSLSAVLSSLFFPPRCSYFSCVAHKCREMSLSFFFLLVSFLSLSHSACQRRQGREDNIIEVDVREKAMDLFVSLTILIHENIHRGWGRSLIHTLYIQYMNMHLNIHKPLRSKTVRSRQVASID